MAVTPNFASTEDALRAMRRAEVVTLAILKDASVMKGRRIRSLGLPAGANSWDLDAMFFRVVSIVESCLDTLSTARFTSDPQFQISNVPNISTVIRQSTSNWKKREQAYKVHHNVDLSTCQRYDEYKTATIVRNCIAHGMGRLTSLYSGVTELAQKLSSLDVAVSDARLTFGISTFDRLFSVCEEFVLDVDSKFPK